jgi:hypothetical protein
VSLAVESAKDIAQELPTSASEPSPSVGATKVSSGLVACEYAESRAFAHRVLQFFDRMKNAIDDQEGEWCNQLRLDCGFIVLICSLWISTGLDARLEAIDKALAVEKIARHEAEQELQASQESNTALNKKL